MVNKINHTQFVFITPVLRIRITLKRMRILLFTLMRIRILPFTVIRMRIQLSSFPDPTFQFDTNPDPDPTFNFRFGSCFSLWCECGSGFPLWCGCGSWSVSSFPKWSGSATLICHYDKKEDQDPELAKNLDPILMRKQNGRRKVANHPLWATITTHTSGVPYACSNVTYRPDQTREGRTSAPRAAPLAVWNNKQK